jgi:hypothetical protein
MFKVFKPFKPPPLSSPATRHDAGEDEEGLSWRFVANYFDIVSVRVEDEGAVII